MKSAKKMEEEKNSLSPEKFSRVRNTKRLELNFCSTCVVNAVGLLAASFTVGEISFNNVFSFAALLCVIWLLNWLLRPLLVLFTLPFVIITMGFGMIFINAAVIYLSAGIVPGIHIGSYLNALWASLLVSAAMWVNVYFRSEGMIRSARTGLDGRNENRDDGAGGSNGKDS